MEPTKRCFGSISETVSLERKTCYRNKEARKTRRGGTSLNIQQLLDIIEVDKYGSITKLSEIHYTSRQTVSARIKELEKELGFDILQRSKQGARVTEKGTHVLEFAKSVLREYERMQQNIREIEEPVFTNDLKIVSARYCDRLTSVAVETFLQREPKTRMYYRNMDTAEVIEAVASEKADIGVFIMSDSDYVPKCQEQGVTFVAIQEVQLYFWASKRHDLGKRTEISYEEALKQPIVVDMSTDIGRTENVFKDAEIIARVSGKNNISELVGANRGTILGFCWCEEDCYSKYNANIIRIPVVNGPKVFWGYCVDNKKEATTEMKKFLKILTL